ncbi:N-terminal nucleophile aminohydrolase [Rhizopogon vinicolor AM-OR11-026]|uniref:N-terminal nucleophile aminohydrolase n=1 Tax=Rhizopogon vinicolor AM-OR11-026 TaxID=1314800 RepID=A0A1B7N6N6_9AGAM|nr:N-terminal nucleophile aminohydrolase [Rhizopogon vinicolor AM-OR11-026]
MPSKNANPGLKPANNSAEPNYVLVIHGGAGTMSREGSTPEQRTAYRAALSRALKAGYNVLKQGGEAMDAVVAAVSVMEDCPLFNSGHGAVFNNAGKNELETSLMVSKPPASHPAMPTSRRGSSVTLITRTRNPSHLARALYLAPELAPHPMLSGATAESIGASLGVRQVDPSYFWTEARWREHRRGLGLPEEPVEYPRPESPGDADSETTDVASFSDDKDKELWEPLDLMPTGTVGAVALDIRGCIAALTSTGGRTNKLVGRVGDTPVMGCGFWAEEWKRDGGFVKRSWDRLRGKSKYEGVGVSGTGDGDYYIRRAAASNIARRMQYLGESLAEATQNVIDDLFNEGGMGGIIALDKDGNVALPLNCSGMYRGVIRPDGVPLTGIFFDDQLNEL